MQWPPGALVKPDRRSIVSKGDTPALEYRHFPYLCDTVNRRRECVAMGSYTSAQLLLPYPGNMRKNRPRVPKIRSSDFRRKAFAVLKISQQGVRNRDLISMLARHFNITQLPGQNQERMALFIGLMAGIKVVRIPKKTYIDSKEFYASDEWMRLRYKALKLHGGLCQCCFNRPTADNPLHVDHVKPRSKYPELELDINNLQVLCKLCNLGKSAWDETDWRKDNVVGLDQPWGGLAGGAK